MDDDGDNIAASCIVSDGCPPIHFNQRKIDYPMVEEAENEMDNKLETPIRVSPLNAYNTMILN